MKQLSIEFTYDCNMRCPWCARAADVGTITGPLPSAELDRLIKVIVEGGYTHFCFHGGEPLCYPEHLIETMETLRCNVQAPTFAIATNGTGLTSELTGYFNAANARLVVSVEAEGYKGLKMLVNKATEPEMVLSNINSLHAKAIRCVSSSLRNFAESTLLLRAVFPETFIEVTPDRTRLDKYTLEDIAAMGDELAYLKEKTSYLNWLAMIGSFYGKCETKEVYGYSLRTGEICEICPYSSHPESGCEEFSRVMKPDVFEAYRKTVKEYII